jgi:hypothetical protein
MSHDLFRGTGSDLEGNGRRKLGNEGVRGRGKIKKGKEKLLVMRET